MAEDASKISNENLKTTTNAQPASSPPKGNPAFRALGLPNFRFRLPSRNWLIFLSITSSFAGAIYYDKRQTRLTQQKWCNLVSHIAREPLPTESLQRRVTIYLQAPPGDGLRSIREHFTEYIKPILVAAAVDWDVVEGRREGEVRAGTADRIRRYRRRQGEDGGFKDDDLDKDELLYRLRERIGVREWPNAQGHLVIGRHTWKEYVRGLHEGWLGPMQLQEDEKEASGSPEGSSENTNKETSSSSKGDLPATPEPEILISPAATPLQDPSHAEETVEVDAQAAQRSEDKATGADAGSTSSREAEKKTEEVPKPARPTPGPPYNTIDSYASSSLPASMPPTLPPSIPLPHPHILGFRNTPIRLYRFLTRRYLADEVGRATAAAVLASNRPFENVTVFADKDDSEAGGSEEHGQDWEQQKELQQEESNWLKKNIERKEGEGERVWLDKVKIDDRVGARMRRFELLQEEDERAKRLWEGIEKSKGDSNGGDDID